jgi:mannose-6-phosphate isomerase-like protein (cupin superfamily)
MKTQPRKTMSMMNVHITFLANEEETAGQWSALEYVAPPQFKGPAPHWHKQTTEAFYIVEGELRFQIDEDVKEAKAGEFVVVPPKTVHAWSNPHAAPSKFLVFLSPSGLEKYFEELEVLMREETTWPPADMTKVIALAEKFDTFSPPTAE